MGHIPSPKVTHNNHMMQYIDNNDSRELSREPSISHEGSDIVFEDLLGDLLQIEPQNNKNKKSINDDKPLNPKATSIEHLFDDTSNDPVHIFTDDEEEDESVEGCDPNNTTFTMPNDHDVDVFDTILQDLDEKTKEIEQNENKKQQKSKQKKKNQKKKSSKPAQKNKPSPNKPSIPSSITIQIGDENEASAIDENTRSRLEKWEFDDKSVRRNIRTLLSTLNQVLPSCLEHKWKKIKMSDLLNDDNVKKQYFKAIRIVHPDKSIGRGDDMETKMISKYIFQALEQSYSKHTK